MSHEKLYITRTRIIEMIHELIPKDAIMVSGSRAIKCETPVSDWDYAIAYTAATKNAVESLREIAEGLGFTVDRGIASAYGWQNEKEYIMRINHPKLRIDLSVVTIEEYKKMQRQFFNINDLLRRTPGLREMVIETKQNLKILHPGIDGVGSSIYRGLVKMTEIK